MKSRVLILSSVIFCIVCAAEARGQGHTIRGKIHNSAGTNLSGITVSLESGTGALINQTVTNNEGDFFFGGLNETSYTMTISAPDYNFASERVEFVRNVTANEPGEMRTIEITLTPKATARIGPARAIFIQNIPRSARIAFERGEQLVREKKFQQAVAGFREALQLFPNYFEAHLSLGSTLLTTGDMPSAISEFELARKINPADARLYQMFGAVMMQQRKFAVAAAAFAEAARIKAEDPQYLLWRGIALIDYASTLDPFSSQSAAARSQALNDAEESLKKAYEVSGKRLLAVHQQLARVYERRGERARAAVELEKYLKKSPTVPNAAAIREAIKKLRSMQ
ncbi:MAG: beta-sandwich domain-containing protein [Pyrinomonadaceae bacterium]